MAEIIGLKNLEHNKIENQSKRMNFSSELLKTPIEDGELGYDKIYIQAQVKKEGSLWVVNVNSSDSTVALNDKIKNEFQLEESPTVGDLRKGGPESSLISGGSFIWIYQDGKPLLTLLKRDADAPTDAGCLTGPAGRCGEKLSKTCLDETNQELIFVKGKKNFDNKIKLVGYYRDEDARELIVHQKLRQVKDVYDSLAKKGPSADLDLLKKIRGEDDVELYCLADLKVAEKGFDSISTRIDGKEIDRVNNATAFFDKANNTLEVREIMAIHIPEGNEVIKIMDGEVFGREIRIIGSLDELHGQQMVPALRDYCSRFLNK